MRARFRRNPADLGLPVTWAEGRAGHGAVLALFGVAVLLFSVIGAVETLGGDGNGDRSVFVAFTFFALMGGGLSLGGVALLRSHRIITIDRDRVTVDKRGLFGRRTWQEPVTAYRGLLHTQEQRSSGKDSLSHTVEVLYLDHPSRHKRIKLHESHSSTELRGFQEAYARLLDRPAVEKSAQGRIRTEVEDLDKSVRELAAEGKLTVDFDPEAPPPGDLDLAVEGNDLVVTIEKKPMGLYTAILLLTTPIVFIIGWLWGNAPVFIGVAGILFQLISVLAVTWVLISKRRIRISPERVQLVAVTPWGETTGQTHEADRIETVRLCGPEGKGAGSKQVLIVTDSGESRIGGRLADEDLQWLTRCILSVITGSGAAGS